MSNIDTIMHLIAWDRTPDEQKKGIDQAGKVRCLKAFFQPTGPGYSKSVWENCAKIVCARSDADLIPYTIDMLLWLQDLNWPGASLVLTRLKEMRDTTVLANRINELIPALILLDELPWVMTIAELLENTELRDGLNRNTIQLFDQVQEKMNS